MDMQHSSSQCGTAKQHGKTMKKQSSGPGSRVDHYRDGKCNAADPGWAECVEAQHSRRDRQNTHKGVPVGLHENHFRGAGDGDAGATGFQAGQHDHNVGILSELLYGLQHHGRPLNCARS